MSRKYVLYIKKKCPFCVKAVNLLREKSIPFNVVAFDNRPTVLKEMKEVYSWQTVPMVFEETENKNFKLIGGYTDLLTTLESNNV
jgi:glutaredoxin 3